MRIMLIRHGMTQGNLEKKYIGSTDQPLCSEGIAALENIRVPHCDRLVASPMKRCMGTSEILFPHKQMKIENDLRECDFGKFENKDHIELSRDPEYQKWIDSGGNMTFPGGESPEDFKNRCVRAFERITGEYGSDETMAFVVHGGTIMAIMERLAVPHKAFYEWHCENGHGYICQYNDNILYYTEKI